MNNVLALRFLVTVAVLELVTCMPDLQLLNGFQHLITDSGDHREKRDNSGGHNQNCKEFCDTAIPGRYRCCDDQDGQNQQPAQPTKKTAAIQTIHINPKETVPNCECGRASGQPDIANDQSSIVDRQPFIDIRIVNGKPTADDEYPWQAALVSSSDNSVYCGATIIGPKHIITAAHCTQRLKMDCTHYEVLVGAHNVKSDDPSQQRIAVGSIIPHKDFNISATYDNDISIIVLSSSIDFKNTAIRPICLPSSSTNDYENVWATVSGWGSQRFRGKQPDVLMAVEVPTITNTKCKKIYEGRHIITSNMLCAGDPSSGQDACQNSFLGSKKKLLQAPSAMHLNHIQEDGLFASLRNIGVGRKDVSYLSN